MTCTRQRAHTKKRPEAGIEESRQCRGDIDRAGGACNTHCTPMLRARGGVRHRCELGGLGRCRAVSSAVNCSSTLSRIPASPPEQKRVGAPARLLSPFGLLTTHRSAVRLRLNKRFPSKQQIRLVQHCTYPPPSNCAFLPPLTGSDGHGASCLRGPSIA